MDRAIRRVFLIIFFLQSFFINAQQNKDVLFKVDGDPVYVDEFLRVFNKNRDIVDEEDRKSVEDYLDLFINYKLKLKQAYRLGFDTLPSYKRELKKYREQLIQPYLKDVAITDSLVKEAHDRMLQEVNASHVLIRLNPKASPTDTLKAYNKIMEARSKIVSGSPFGVVAQEYSEDPSAKKNGGDLGYFTAFGMVYPFESAAYTTKIDQVSMPFRTSFGYHIVKVNDKRPSRGEVEVAHIMIKNNPQDSTYAKKQIDDIYAKLQQEGKFDFLAQQYSDDKSSAPKGGRLPKFAANKMIQSFADVAFSLKKENDISQPFKTPYGWHIVKLIKKYPVKSFDELKHDLKNRIERSSRASAAGKSVVKRLKKKYNIVYNLPLKQAFLNNNSSVLEASKNETLFTINKASTKLKELIAYNLKQRNKSLATTYNDFLDEKIIHYYKDHLEETNQDFATIMQEYKDGLLLFDLLQDRVWKRAELDSVALKKFFDNNRKSYMHNKRGDLVIGTSTELSKAKLVKKYLEEGKSTNEIKDLVNESPTIHVLFSKGIVEATNKKLPKDFILEKGVSKIYKEGDNNYIVVKVTEVLEPSFKELKEARGLVINDFQEHIEKEWVDTLRNSHHIKVNKRALKKLVKEYPK